MSVSVLVIGLVHTVPVLLVGLFCQGRWNWLHGTALGSGIFAAMTGADAFLALDLLFIAGAWFMVRQHWQTQGL